MSLLTLRDLTQPANVIDARHALHRALEGGSGLDQWARDWGDAAMDVVLASFQQGDGDAEELNRLDRVESDLRGALENIYNDLENLLEKEDMSASACVAINAVLDKIGAAL